MKSCSRIGMKHHHGNTSIHQIWCDAFGGKTFQTTFAKFFSSVEQWVVWGKSESHNRQGGEVGEKKTSQIAAEIAIIFMSANSRKHD